MVLSGDIVACDRVRKACARHLADLERQSTPEFPYHFDALHAQKVCQFFPIFCRHSIGEFAGFPFELEDWQLFGIASIFGWKRDVDNSRRFRKVYWSMARKNGKSSLAAVLCHYMAAGDIDPKTNKPEAVGQILLTACKKDQAKVIYGEAERMRLQSPQLSKMSHVRYETITYHHNQSYIRMVSSLKAFSGLNPHFICMDELHEWKSHHADFYNTMVTGSGSRSQPLHLIITTAGSDNSHLWLEDYKHATNVLDGVFADESLFAYIFELDDKDEIEDESTWIKANPNLGVSVNLDYLRQRWNEDKQTPAGLNRFRRYHGNRIVTSSEKAFDLKQWDACQGTFSDWSKADAIGAGVDLGGRDDMAAYALCARFRTNPGEDPPFYRYEVRVKAFIGDDTKRDLTKLPFVTWTHYGLLQRTKYPILELQRQLITDCQAFEIATVAYDPHNGQQLGDSLTEEGLTAARMAQNQTTFNEPIRNFQDLVVKKLITHDGNPLLRWCVSNAIIISNRADRWMFDKSTSSDKIDPLVASIMAFHVASSAPERVTGSLFLI